MTDLDETIRRVRELDAAATDGGVVHYVHGYGFSSHPEQDGPATPNTAALCLMRTAAPLLADECERLQDEGAELFTALERSEAECERLRERVRVLEAERDMPCAHRLEEERLEAVLRDFADADCEYGDNCPPFGTRHGRCVGCKARAALKGGE